MKKILLLIIFFLPVFLLAQNQPPVALPDSTETLSQVPVSLNVLLNDYDPDGDIISIRNLRNPEHGDNWYEDSIVTYVSEYYFGRDSMKYRVHDHPYLDESEYTYIYVNVLENPDVPYAVNDTFTIKSLEPADLDILANDMDPNGDELIVDEVSFTSYRLDVVIAPDASYVTVTSKYGTPGEYGFNYVNIEKETPTQYYSNEARVHLIIEENPDIPTAVNDTFIATGGIMAVFDILTNDLDPSGDTIEIFEYTFPQHASIILEDNHFLFTAQTSYVGNTSFAYKIRYKNKPWLYSEEAEVYITVESNPDRPFGEPDYGSGMAWTDIFVNVLANDHDPNGDAIEIKDVYCMSYPFSTIDYTEDTIIYRPQPCQIGPDTVYYCIQKIDAPEYYSEWIPIVYDVEWNPGYPKTFPDSAVTRGGMDILVDFRSNDYIPDSLDINQVWVMGWESELALVQTYSDSVMLYRPFPRSSGRDTLKYILANMQNPPVFYAEGEIYVEVVNNHAYDSLNINNINAGFNASGLQFSRIDEILGEGIHEYKPHFEAPKGSGKHTIFSNTLWIGGIDDTGYLHVAAERYRQVGIDIQPGPVFSGDYDSIFFKKWHRIWKLDRWEVTHHINNWWKEGYEPIEPIATWPGNGEGNGMSEQLAPYFDQDGDGIYDPYSGDYPLIRGEQCLYFITNDDKYHGESQGAPMLVEIHGMAYAYDAPDDSILDNTIFIHYDLINRSENTYYDTYFGFFTDFDLGYAYDDRVGSHVMGNSFYVYNGEDPDGNDEPETYGDHPPAQSHTILAGPFIDPDLDDNPSGSCDHSLIGLNFGNGIVDDERYGLTRFTYFNSSGGPQGDPGIHEEYYKFMKGLWKDDSAVSFGGGGHFYSGAVGPYCRYMFPGDTDPYNWGTECVLPNDGYNQNEKWWTEEEADMNPYDRRGMGSCGPFTFLPGDVQEVDMAYVFANSYYSADSSKNLLIERLYELRQRVLDGEIVIPNDELYINEITQNAISFELYPNPAGSLIYINADIESSKAKYRIINTMGMEVIRGNLAKEINISALKPGFYIISIITGKGIISNKFIKH